MRHTVLLMGWLVLAVGLVAGCVGKPIVSPTAAAPQQAGPAFFPALPDAPRIHYLTTLSSDQDLAPRRDAFAQFIVGSEKEPQRLVQPYGSALWGHRLYVADTGAKAVAIFDLAGRKFSLLSGHGPGRMALPINVRIDQDGTKYVTDTARDQILVYDSQDRYVTAFGRQGQFKPVDVAIAGDRLYVSDIKHHQIHVLDKQSGRTITVIGKAGSAEGELFHPTNLALLGQDVLVVETGNFRVQRFSPDGRSLHTYGMVGTGPGSFARPKGIAVDRAGRIYVADAAFENVQLFDADGRLLLFFGQSTDGYEGLNLPGGVSLDYDHVADFQRYADPRFRMEYLILVSSQFGPNKVDVFAFGRMSGLEYPDGKG